MFSGYGVNHASKHGEAIGLAVCASSLPRIMAQIEGMFKRGWCNTRNSAAILALPQLTQYDGEEESL
jgi:hypothetical protein